MAKIGKIKYKNKTIYPNTIDKAVKVGSETLDKTVESLKQKDSTLQSNINIVSTNLSTEVSTRETQINSTITKIDDVKSTANTALKIAKGSNQSVSFSTYKDTITFLNKGKDNWKTTYGSDVNVGQNIYIATKEVPDIWIAELKTSSTSYTYSSDSQVVTDLNSINGLIGSWYVLRPLETQKVDLTSYAKKTDLTDKLSTSLTTASAIGRIPAGSVFAINTPIRDIVVNMFNYVTPQITNFSISNGTTTWNTNTNIVCSSTPITFTKVTHCESGIDSIKNKQVNLRLGSVASTETAVSSVTTLTKSVSFNISTAKASFTALINGYNTLGSPITQKAITLTAYMPVCTYICANQTQATITAGLANAVVEVIAHVGIANIDKTYTFTAGGCWCVALPSHLTLNAIGTVADFGFNTQQTTATSYTATRTINGISNVSYTIYVLPIATAQTNLAVRIQTKAK